jgi:putative resolvase
MEPYLPTKQAAKKLNVHPNTLRKWADDGKISYIRAGKGAWRKYNIESTLQMLDQSASPAPKASATASAKTTAVDRTGEEDDPTPARVTLAYCRVSSRQQADDLERQVQWMRDNHGLDDKQIITDIGSGLNFKRKGLQTLLARIIKGEVQQVLVAHRDRLCRFGVELIEWICKQYHTELVVCDAGQEKQQNIHERLVEDMLAIVTVFGARVNGMRKYKRSIEQHTTDSPANKRQKEKAPESGDSGEEGGEETEAL